jgi:anti-sigma regulatory factor (Ser/Thr protein kinase)
MKELSLHILDIVQNSIRAGATSIKIIVAENLPKNSYEISIRDNGCGMDNQTLTQITDPFFTTGKKKTGLGIPLFKQHAEAAGGSLTIKSEKEKGTTVEAIFEHNHIDRQPMGDIAGTIIGLIRSSPEIEFIYRHSFNNKHFTINTNEIKNELKEININNLEIISFLTDMINENIEEITN